MRGWVWGGLVVALTRSAFGAERPVLTTAEEVRRLSAEEADSRLPVRLEGVLTFFDQRKPSRQFRFLQDDTAGIYIYPNASVDVTKAAPGQRAEIEGTTGRGEFAPVVLVQKMRLLGPGTFPTAKPVSFEQLSTGQEDSQFVEIRGVVRAARLEEQRLFFSIEIATGEGKVTAFANEIPVTRPDDLVDSTVRIRGVCFTHFNRQRQFFNFGLLVPRMEDIAIEIPAPPDPFAIPAQGIGSLLRYSPQTSYGHRSKVIGTVTLRYGDRLYVQHGQEAMCVQTKQTTRVEVGEQIEVIGFPARGYTPMLESGIYRKIEPGDAVKPAVVTVDQALGGDFDCRLVTLEATLLDRAEHSQEPFLVLQGGGFVFHAYLREQAHNPIFERLEKGSRVTVTGVCSIEPGEEWHYGQDWRAASFRILLRSPADVVVLHRPPWWTLRKLLWAVGILMAAVLGAFGWVAFLRRRVQQQTRIINEKLLAEAALKERYVDLFENANDMVLTHDLSGRLTSINSTGERLLQRNRGELLSQPLVELVAEEQRPAAGRWLEQVLKGAEPPGAEWDFMNASGERVKLELNTRMIDQNGKPLEVEVIGRDITERRHLENQILEISSKEQQRIGHDLHDGVCQQLAAIAYRTHILARRLQSKDALESAEAEGIGDSINESLVQTRGVARGLFPVRLEANGLVSALEELAANISSLFKVNCSFVSTTPTAAVEYSVALHVYYIAQEAAMNAARHSKAEKITIRLAEEQGRLVLSVEDDGSGFAPAHNSGGGMGIAIMRYRARVIGATLDLNTKAGQGTRVTCGFQVSAQKSYAHQ